MQTAFNYQAYHVTIKGNEFGYKVIALPDYEGEVLRHHFTGFLLQDVIELVKTNIDEINWG